VLFSEQSLVPAIHNTQFGLGPITHHELNPTAVGRRLLHIVTMESAVDLGSGLHCGKPAVLIYDQQPIYSS